MGRFYTMIEFLLKVYGIWLIILAITLIIDKLYPANKMILLGGFILAWLIAVSFGKYED